MIIDPTHCNLSFIEEILQAPFNDSALVRDEVVNVTRALGQLRLSPTVQGRSALPGVLDSLPSTNNCCRQSQ
jgi:hypothetical protein